MTNTQTDLKKLRESLGISQQQASDALGVSLRSYKDYENKEEKRGTWKYSALFHSLYSIYLIDEDHGILSIEAITKIVSEILNKYEIKYCYLFGSYAKNRAKNDSDIDLLIAGNVNGIHFYGLVEELRQALHKRIDLLDTAQVTKNPDLLEEIMKDGIKIYG